MHEFETSRPSTAEAIRDEAAAWSDRLRHRDGEPGLRAEFERWRAQDPAHAAAFARIDAAHRMARAANGSEPMAALAQETRRRVAARKRKQQRRNFAIAASFAVAAIAGFAVSGMSLRDLTDLPDQARHALAGESVYRTAVGERRAVTLEDGSVLTLNTDSRAVIRYREHTRGVTLLHGQALFEVAHDASRPFVVTAGNRTVTALGTAFDVRLSSSALEVVLIEGRVAVADTGAAEDGGVAAPALLAPGEQLVVATADSAASVPVIRKTDVERAVSWREGHLIFRSDRLDHVIAEVNRYSTRRIELADSRLGELRISGIVNTGNTAVFVETMTSYYPLQVIDSNHDRVLLGRRG